METILPGDFIIYKTFRDSTALLPIVQGATVEAVSFGRTGQRLKLKDHEHWLSTSIIVAHGRANFWIWVDPEYKAYFTRTGY